MFTFISCEKEEAIPVIDERDSVTGTYVGYRTTYFTTFSGQVLRDTFKSVVIISRSSKDSIITVTCKPKYSDGYTEYKYHNGKFMGDLHAFLEVNGDELYLRISPGLTGNNAEYFCTRTDRPDTVIYIEPEPVDPCPVLKVQQLSHQWMAPFDSKTFEIYEDNNGVIDTMWITRTMINDTCIWYNAHSSIPCTTNCDIRTVELISGNNDRVNLVMKVNGTELSVNALSGIPMRYDLLQHYPLSTGGVPFYNYYSWLGQEATGYYTKEIKAYCNSPAVCESMYELQSYTISRASGLIEYSTKGGRVWHKKL